MRLVYFDEAGISNPKHEPFLVVAGVIVNADRCLNALERHLEKLVTRHIPEENRGGFVFHATEIFNGGKTIVRSDPRWTPERRFVIADDLAAIPRKFGLQLAFGIVERATFPRTFEMPQDMSPGDLTVAAHAVAFTSCAMLVEHWMRRSASDEICLLVVENNERAKKIIRDTQEYHQDRRIEPLLTDAERRHFPFRKIKEDPLFQEKRRSSPLQVADFCAYILKRALMGDNRFERFMGPLREKIIIYDDISEGRSSGSPARKPRPSRQPQPPEQPL